MGLGSLMPILNGKVQGITMSCVSPVSDCLENDQIQKADIILPVAESTCRAGLHVVW